MRIFTHIQDNTEIGSFDRNKIRHSASGTLRCLVLDNPVLEWPLFLGVVAKTEFLAQYEGSETERLQAIVGETPSLASLLKKAEWDTPGPTNYRIFGQCRFALGQKLRTARQRR